jgi:N-acyl-D-amino-acid deacylase
MQQPYHTAGSDGILVGQKPHPRAWGTFARYLAHYARDEGMFSWERVVLKMSSLPCRRLRQWDRGLIRPGMAADIVAFDPQTVRDTATYDNPQQYPEGIPYVAVNGVLVKDEGRHTGALPGRVLTLGGSK